MKSLAPTTHRRPRAAPSGLPSWVALLSAGKPTRRANGPPAPSRPEQERKPRPAPHEPPKPPKPSKKAAAKPAKRVDRTAPSFGHLNRNNAPVRYAEPDPSPPRGRSEPRMATAADIHRAAVECRRPAIAIRPPEDSTAGRVLAAGEKARSKTRSELPPIGSLARRIIDAGRKARGEAPTPT
jgi:hypothetical protein